PSKLSTSVAAGRDPWARCSTASDPGGVWISGTGAGPVARPCGSANDDTLAAIDATPSASAVQSVLTRSRRVSAVRMSLRSAKAERHDAVVGRGVVEEPSAGRGNDHVLPAVASLIRHRRRLSGAAELERPQLRARLRVERAKAGVIGRGHEDE